MSLFVLSDMALERGEVPTVPHDGSPEVAGELTWVGLDRPEVTPATDEFAFLQVWRVDGGRWVVRLRCRGPLPPYIGGLGLEARAHDFTWRSWSFARHST